MIRGQDVRQRSPRSRLSKCSLRRWSPRRRTRRTGRERRWPSAQDCRRRRSGGSGERLNPKPHRTDTFKLSTDPLFVEKVYDICGLYLNPPEAAVVLSVDEKSQVQALARSQPAFPMMPGICEKRTHDYLRHGTTSLFAAFNIADGSVISSTHRRHRTIEFKKFLVKIDSQVPEHLDVHLVCENYATHKSPAIRRWLETHPRFHVHYTPTYASWINQVERWFAYLTDDLLRRSDHRSVQALENDIRNWVTAWNENPKPFIWTKTAEQILQSLSRLLKRTNDAGH